VSEPDSSALYRAAGLVRTAVRSALADHACVIVALSGGVDSLTLLRATLLEGDGLRVIAGIVDHGLQEDSAAVAERVAVLASQLGCQEVHSLPVVVPETSAGPEAAAREARYHALTTLADRVRADRILLGHTLDDQAETVLLGLARGSGTRSLAGMSRQRGLLNRPLLGLRRHVLEQAAHYWELEPWLDPHNQESRFARVRVRQTVLPVLEAELGPGIAEALARTAGLAAQDADALDSLAEREYRIVAAHDGSLAVRPLQQAPAALASRVIRLWLRARGVPANDLSAGHIGAVLRLVHQYRGQGPLSLPGHLRVHRTGDSLWAVSVSNLNSEQPPAEESHDA